VRRIISENILVKLFKEYGIAPTAIVLCAMETKAYRDAIEKTLNQYVKQLGMDIDIQLKEL